MAAGPVEIEVETSSCLELGAAILQCARVVMNETFLLYSSAVATSVAVGAR